MYKFIRLPNRIEKKLFGNENRIDTFRPNWNALLHSQPTVGEITARQTRKHGVTKLCSVAYLTTEIELVLPTFKSWTVHKIMEYFTL